MDELKRRLIDNWQGGFPLCERPFAVVAERLDSSESAVLCALRELLAEGTLTRFGPLYQIEDFECIAGIVNDFPEVAHNYQRSHALNMWFVLATETPEGIDDVVERIAAATGLPVFNFPKEREYFLEARFTVGGCKMRGNAAPPSPPTPLPPGERGAQTPSPLAGEGRGGGAERLIGLRSLILATQAGLPLTPQPYHALAAQLNSDAETVMVGLQTLLDIGAIRRIGVVPNHYRIGYVANGMTVWDVADPVVDQWGVQVGALDFVTHCYRRPRHLPDWPYNLFAMAHGASRDEVAVKAERIAEILGDACRARDILYSTRILKKTGLRLNG